MTRSIADAQSPELGNQGDLLELIRSRVPSLPASGRQVAETVLRDSDHVIGMSAARLAKTSETSVGSVVRFCQGLGLPGYNAFQLRLAASLGHGLRSTVEGRPAPESVAERVLWQSFDDLARSVASIDVRVLRRAADVIRSAERLLICSSGPSQPVAVTLGSSLSRAGLTVQYPSDVETQEAVARLLGPQDVCIGVSHSGTTTNTLRSVEIAAVRGAPTVAITSFANSPIAETCDVVLVAGAPADAYRSADTASRIVHHALIQALTAEVLNP
ncbi:MurR/RpiR family transcriptional regulator [Gryllotalpicola reticulitermitis]|uniref:MurR/RpiR family transcriptional regulator n=1 Tax=Gryllotalpicola reticulitermitis TaxID=1184153 RepID=A0ABV8Q9W6_9MICO